MTQYQLVTFGALEICYLEKLDGGGIALEKDFVALVKQCFGKVNRICEWCSGPGFIGFSLLAHGLCSTLCLIDINPEAVEACRATIERNHLEQTATVYLSDCLDSIPEDERWDLVVGNPPHIDAQRPYAHLGSRTLYLDEGWSIHNKFYRQVGKHLTQNGNVLLIEHASFSQPETFRSMIEAGGLVPVSTYRTQLPSRLYYIRSTRPDYLEKKSVAT